MNVHDFPNLSCCSGAVCTQAFAGDPDYAPYGKARSASSESQFYIIDDTDVAGTIPYLAKPAE